MANAASGMAGSADLPGPVAPATVGAGATRALRWLARLPRAWVRGWLSLANTLGPAPHYLAGPSLWLVREELARRDDRSSGSAGGGGAGAEEGDDGGPTLRGVMGDGGWTAMVGRRGRALRGG